MKVKAIPFEAAEKWKVDDAGLPPRVVNCARKKGVKTFGALNKLSHEELLSIRALGRSSLAAIREFVKQVRRLSKGELEFGDVADVLKKFLGPFELEVLTDRYGLKREEPEAGRNYYKLQQIANRHNLTRERVRQVEEKALDTLRSRMVSACLQPFAEFVEREIKERGGIVAFSDLSDLNPSELTRELNPGPLAFLFCDLFPERFREDGACISVLKGDVLQRLRNELPEILNSQQTSCTAQQLTDEIHARLPFAKGISLNAIRRMLETDPRVLILANRSYLCSKDSLVHIVARVMRRLSSPAHFREIARATNQRMMPESRRGAGFYLRILNSSPRFAKENFGFYRLLE